MGSIRKIAIIGMGPRGLYCLENFLKELDERNALPSVHILLFEERAELGSSIVYDTEQVDSNWINLTERLIDLEPRDAFKVGGVQIKGFAGFRQWLRERGKKTDYDKLDAFPARNFVGRFLRDRATSLCDDLIGAGLLTLVGSTVVDATFAEGRWEIRTADEAYTGINEILLTIGHQPAETPKDVKNWQGQLEDLEKPVLHTDPYPLLPILKSLEGISTPVVAIRGFGLAMIDVCRSVAEKHGRFTKFEEDGMNMVYTPAGSGTPVLVPFSLDGLPMSPKPLNRVVDTAFAPDDEQLKKLEGKLSDRDAQSNARSTQFLIGHFLSVATDVLKDYKDLNLPSGDFKRVANEWLKDEEFEHPSLLNRSMPADKMMVELSDMAMDAKPATVDFFIGQVWRHCQPAMYRAFEYNRFPSGVMADVIGLDERLKRYTYGPPVEAIAQLLALKRAGMLTLDYINDPEINLGGEGWKIAQGDRTITAGIMVDSVLASPRLKEITSELVLNLKRKKYVFSYEEELGIETDEDSMAVNEDGENVYPLAVVGRLAKGTLMGTDALLECFGNPPRKWAVGAADRLAKSVHAY